MMWNIYIIFESCVFALFVFKVEVGAVICVYKTHEMNYTSTTECSYGCLAAWFNRSGAPHVQQQGCWDTIAHTHHSRNYKCEGISQVKGKKPPYPVVCFCRKSYCNRNVTWVGTDEDPNAVYPKVPSDMPQPKQNNDHIIFVVVAIVGTVMVLIVLFLVYMKKRAHFKPELENVSKASEVETLIPSELLPPIDLKDVLSQGQFCIVRKGRMGHKDVAVKIFPISQCSKPTPSALTEEDIYIVCKLSHENILKFIGKHIHEEGSQQQLWLVTEYIEQGSLSDFLKRNTISWENLFHMAQGMALGMAYLHAEIPRVKPSIAHRDIKSKNILVKNNLTCCISDFGLSLKFNDDTCGDTHGQVGTRRYMAPEVLEGAINFSREAFLRIDMYAFALCLWELLTRCTAVQEEPVGDYKMPFEEEVGIHPSLEELQDYVVNKKTRPTFPAEWKNKDQAIDGVIVTIEECWDHDADARLTADCVAERVKQLCVTGKRQTNSPLAVSFKSIEQENVLLA